MKIVYNQNYSKLKAFQSWEILFLGIMLFIQSQVTAAFLGNLKGKNIPAQSREVQFRGNAIWAH